MGTVHDLTRYRTRRLAQTRSRLLRQSLHPSLRWVAGDVFYIAHRRDRRGGAACGAAGDLTLAPPGVPLCGACYPQTGT